MAPMATQGSSSQLVVVGDRGGVTVINPSTPLKRLNYFDGKFLRASDFDVEQNYLRQLVAQSNQGLGSGVVYGYDTTLGGGDTIEIGPGLAIDPSGHVLLLQSPVSQSIQALIDQSRRPAPVATPRPLLAETGLGTFSDCVEVAAPPPTAVVPVSDIYVIAICAAEALCGQEDVFGKLCEDACVTTTDRPYRLDGIVLRAIPLQLVTPFPTSKVVPLAGNAYLRSKVAHSWFADEVLKHPNAISRTGLLSDVWCLGSAYDSGCCEVPLAVVARAGSTTIFLDPWIVRRERMDAPSRRYWQWTMRMRPWDVFLAQILQFQCQLADLLDGVATPGGRTTNPCGPQHQALQEAADLIQQVRAGLVNYRTAAGATTGDRPALLSLSLTKVADLHEKLTRVIDTGQMAAPTDRILVRGGIVELPSAGYLPVVNGSDVTVNDQVRALLGDGLDLRFCITTADYIAHAVEEAQHMDRISLLQGLDDPRNKPHVDIWVPDGTLATSTTPAAGLYDAALTFSAEQTGGLLYRGAAREETQASGGVSLAMGAAGISQTAITKFQTLAKAVANPKTAAKAYTITPNIDSNAFVATPKTAGAKLDTLVANTASSARMFTAGDVSAATRKKMVASEGRLATTQGAVDGMWLTARTDHEWRTLGVDGHAPVTLRVVIGSRPASPLAIDLSFTGTLSITGVASGPVLTGTLNGIVAVGMLKENQANEQTVETLVTERFNWPVTITYADAANGIDRTIALDMTVGGTKGAAGETTGGMHLRFLKTVSAATAPIRYELSLVTQSTLTEVTNLAGTTGTSLTLGRLNLRPDADVINPSNAFHQYAESGLDIVQAALIVSEPNIESNAESILFPARPAATKELKIDAVRDWVAFTRRREKQCAAAEPPAPPAPPRVYRVINLRVSTLDEATRTAEQLTARLHDPASVVQTIQALLLRDEKLDDVKLFVKYAGGTAQAISDLAAAESDWKTLNPGDTIAYAAIGAVGETDQALQIKRLGTFEGAISVDSRETPTTKEDTIIPYPQAAAPPNADGLMVFVTVPRPAAARHALIVYAAETLVNDERQHALMPPPNVFTHVVPPSPSVSMDFDDNVPQGNTLPAFIASLTPNQLVLGVTLETVKGAPDTGAQARLEAVLKALVDAGRPEPAPTRRARQALNAHDRTELQRVGYNPDDYDDVIFLEPNEGA